MKNIDYNVLNMYSIINVSVNLDPVFDPLGCTQ